MKKIIGSLFLVLFLIVGVTTKAMNSKAQSVRDEKKVEIEVNKTERQEAIEAKKEERIQERCENVEERIQNRITNLNQNHKNRKEAYGQIENKIENLIISLKKQNRNTVMLESKFQDLKSLLNSFYAEHEQLMNELNTTESYVCGKSEGEFKNQLSQSREQLKNAHQARIKVRNYFFEELRPVLLEIRKEFVGAEVVGD